MIGEKLKEIREQTGLATITEVTSCKAAEIAVNYVDILQIGARNMQNFDVSIDYILGLQEEKEIKHSYELKSVEYNHIEKYRSLDPYGQETVSYILDREYERVASLQKQEGRIRELEAETAPLRIIAYYQKLASAGSGDYLFDDIPTTFIKVNDSPIARQADFVIGVNGQSMEDTYFDGDKVFVKKLPSIATGEIGVFTKGNDCYIKELGADRLISHNKDKNTYPDIPANEDIKLVGKVLGKVYEPPLT